jgi:cation:H+ antiporter
MILTIVLLALGFVLLIKGADWTVEGSAALAKKFNVSDLVIGLTIVAFGTSAPELVVNAFASYQNYSDIVFGNILGSNNFNLFIILGIVGLLSPIVVKSSTVWKEIPISLLAAVLLFVLCNSFIFNNNILSRFDAALLLLIFGGFLFYIFKQLKENLKNENSNIQILPNKKIILYIIGGLAGLIIGGKLVVDSAIEIAISFGLSEKLIGLTIVAAGTSLPELVTSIMAVHRKNSDIAIGNVIGSNIFNILLILPISALINPIAYNTKFNSDIYILIFGTLFLFIAMFTGEKKKLDRWESAILLVFYLSYTWFVIL